MKQRLGFVSNSSSSSFVIIGKGKNKKEIIERFRSEMQEWTITNLETNTLEMRNIYDY